MPRGKVPPVVVVYASCMKSEASHDLDRHSSVCQDVESLSLDLWKQIAGKSSLFPRNYLAFFLVSFGSPDLVTAIATSSTSETLYSNASGCQSFDHITSRRRYSSSGSKRADMTLTKSMLSAFMTFPCPFFAGVADPVLRSPN